MILAPCLGCYAPFIHVLRAHSDPGSVGKHHHGYEEKKKKKKKKDPSRGLCWLQGHRNLLSVFASSCFTHRPPFQNHDLAFHSLPCHTHRTSLECPLFFSPSRKIQPILRRPAELLPLLGSPADLQAELDGLSSMTPMHSGSQSVVPGSAASISKFLPSTPDLLNHSL